MMRHAYLLVGAMGATAMAVDPVEAGRGDREIMFHKTRVSSVLFLGNSITLHGPAPAIGWPGNWGMAASSAENDYVHLVLRAFTEAGGKQPRSLVTNIATFEREYETYDIRAKLKKELAFKADLVILAIGENVSALTSDQAKSAFKVSVTGLLKELKAASAPTIVVRSSFWPSAAKDTILRQACEAAGGIFVDNGALGKDERYYARSEREFSHKGVAAHPGDRGMRAIADAILQALGAPGTPTDAGGKR